MERIKIIILTILDYIGVIWFVLGAIDILKGSSLYEYCVIYNKTMALMLIGAIIIKIIFRNKQSENFYCFIVTAILFLNSIGLEIDLSNISNIVINCISFIFVVISWCKLLRFPKPMANGKTFTFLHKYINKIVVVLLLIQCTHFIVIYGLCIESIIINIILFLLILMRKSRFFSWLYYIYSTTIIGLLITIFYYCGIDFQNYVIKEFYPFDDFIFYLVPNIICASMNIMLNSNYPNAKIN